MNRFLLLPSFLLVFMVAACTEQNDSNSEDQKTESNGEETSEEQEVEQLSFETPAFDASSLQQALNIQPCTQVISTDQSNMIGNGDLQMDVPPYAFVDEKGNYPETVKMEYYVADNISSMIASELTTLDQNGDILSSNGMFFLNATTENGEQLAISNESGIAIRVGTKTLDQDFRVYGGTKKEGTIAWTAEETPAEPIISFKASVIYPDHYWMNVPPEYRTTLNDPKFDNSNLTTLAVRDRLRMSEEGSNYLNWLNEDYDLNSPPPDIMNIYIDNRDRPIWISDSLVVEHIQNALEHCKATRGDCPHERDLRIIIDLYKGFKQQRLQTPFDFGPYMEALSSDNPMEALIDQGISKARSGFILSLYQRKEELSSSLDRNNKLRNKVNSYQLNQLGWSNIDKLFKLGKLKYPKIVAKIKDYDKSVRYKSYLLIPRFRVLVNLYQTDGIIKLNENEDQYGLSMYDDCKIVVLGIKGETFSIGQTKFTATKDREFDIELEGTTIEDFKLLLNRFD